MRTLEEILADLEALIERLGIRDDEPGERRRSVLEAMENIKAAIERGRLK